MTEREFLTAIAQEDVIKSNAEYLEKVTHMIERLDKKNASRSNKPTKRQLLNLEIRDKIMEALDKPMTIKEITDIVVEAFPSEDISGQRITSVLTPMTQPSEKYPNRTGELKMEKIKRVSYYSKAGA